MEGEKDNLIVAESRIVTAHETAYKTYIKTAHMIDVEEILEEIFKNNKFSQYFLNQNGIALFKEDDYIIKNKIGGGSFGKVYRAASTDSSPDNIYMAIKVINMSGIALEDKKMNIASFLVEKKVMEKLSTQKTKYITDLKGAHYLLDKNNEIESLILVSTLGNRSLFEMIRKRARKFKAEKTLYNEEEATNIIRFLAKGLRFLQEHRIYHSDIKPQNIVINLEKNAYQFIDFGMSKIIPEGSDLVERAVYATGGTQGYMSPEKEEFWEICLANKELKEDQTMFNPFKCDVWSLGVCLLDMIGKGKLGNISEKIKELIAVMLNVDWKLRMDSVELDQYIDKNFGSISEQVYSPTEEALIEELDASEN